MESKTCNMCSKETEFDKCKDMQEILVKNNTFHSINLTFGYGSSEKMQKVNFILCESCVSSIIKGFQIPINSEPI